MDVSKLYTMLYFQLLFVVFKKNNKLAQCINSLPQWCAIYHITPISSPPAYSLDNGEGNSSLMLVLY